MNKLFRRISVRVSVRVFLVFSEIFFSALAVAGAGTGWDFSPTAGVAA